ncbi:sensor histidine kinase [Erythrobacter sp. A30-3]|nr:sensor histidine kinase [Erythrobacter sp. A30-3]
MASHSWLTALVAFVLAFWPQALRADELPPAIELKPDVSATDVVAHIRYTRDQHAIEGLSLTAFLNERLQPISGRAAHFGAPGDRIALAIRVRNVGQEAGSWIVSTGRGSLSYFRMYESRGDRLALLVDGTDPSAAAENLRTYQAFSSELLLQPNEERTIVIDFRSENSTYMPLVIQTYGDFFSDRRTNIAMVAGVVLGVLVLIFLNFVFFSITGHREFAWLALAQALFALNTVHAEGYLTIFFLPDSPMLGVAIEDAIKCGFAAAMTQFARSFMRTAELFPRRDLFLKIVIAVSLLVIALQAGLAIYEPALRNAIHAIAWLVAVVVALYLPFLAVAGMRTIGRQLWPLLIGWGSLALFIVYAAVASMGVFDWLPINWHLAGPVGLFESLMVTLALGLHLKKLQADKREADSNYAQSMAERLAISEDAQRLAEEKAFALATVNSQNALLHASGHDSQQVILALNSAVHVLDESGDPDNRELADMLRSSADYLAEIATTTMSGAAIVGENSGAATLSCFSLRHLAEPLIMMFRGSFAAKGLTLQDDIEEGPSIVSDRPVLMRALANILSNAYTYTSSGGARLSMRVSGGKLIIELTDTGEGIEESVLKQLHNDHANRTTAGEKRQGTGSGFRSAKRLIEGLGGELTIVTSGLDGTTIRAILPGAFEQNRSCTIAELEGRAPGWHIIDVDRVPADQTSIARRVDGRKLAAATYDDTTITRGRLSRSVDVILIKPLYCEMADHPLLKRESQEL